MGIGCGVPWRASWRGRRSGCAPASPASWTCPGDPPGQEPEPEPEPEPPPAVGARLALERVSEWATGYCANGRVTNDGDMRAAVARPGRHPGHHRQPVERPGRRRHRPRPLHRHGLQRGARAGSERRLRLLRPPLSASAAGLEGGEPASRIRPQIQVEEVDGLEVVVAVADPHELPRREALGLGGVVDPERAIGGTPRGDEAGAEAREPAAEQPAAGAGPRCAAWGRARPIPSPG
ncbi:MAG: hypothetical protein R3F43_20000 [bacterium]